MKIQISTLDNTGDVRGFAFTATTRALEFVGRVADIHFASASPGTVRGNHYHVRKRQVVIVLPGPSWSLHCDEGEGTPVHCHSFDGSGAMMVLVLPGCALAVRNDGQQPLWLAMCSSRPYDPKDIVARKVI
jgi:dTDP-4-dehydrorhamnose 3,5-epimerase-like enzyme